ncbi:M15 family metallopeptidase [Bacillus sp. ISL-57]|uniref:M15 family metallopeptidase n=1 Tax=Bacillus sp. ISL-57 TaxID=2819135 RepID=UPI001BED3A19|nr:M15 family metallopeptidase [Bacillus sp. ISL-57]MBT2718084.1 M15 family metallopeptidase [Bacillus sp. ISL-57]
MDITKACRDINELSSVAKKACNLFLNECEKAGVDIFITETYRSQSRQNYLYEQGRTRKGDKVTWTRSSNHTGRMAWDIAVMPPKYLYDLTTLEKAGAIARKLGIEWGGDWKTNIDRPHFQVNKNWKAPVEKKVVKTYTVKAGDSLSKILKTNDKKKLEAFAKKNKLKNIHSIYVGQKLKM